MLDGRVRPPLFITFLSFTDPSVGSYGKLCLSLLLYYRMYPEAVEDDPEGSDKSLLILDYCNQYFVTSTDLVSAVGTDGHELPHHLNAR